MIAAIPEKSIPALPAGLLSALPEDTVVIDTGNYVPSSGTDALTPSTPGCPKASGCKHSYTTRWSRRSTPSARQALAGATPEQTASWRSQHPQHTKPNTAMHPGSRTGVRFVLASPSDPSRLDDFNDWYDTYSAAITVPGYLANDARFENPGTRGSR